MSFETRTVRFESYLSRRVAGMEERRHCVMGSGLVVCNSFCASIDFFGGGCICSLDCDNVWIWVRRLPL